MAGAWLPVVDNLERAIAHAGDQSDAVVEGVRSILGQAIQVLEQLGYPRDAQSGVPFDPQRHEVVGVVEQGTAHPGRLSRCCARATGKARANCGRRPWWSADARSDIGWPATTTKSSGCRKTRPPSRFSGHSARWPANITRGCQQGSAAGDRWGGVVGAARAMGSEIGKRSATRRRLP